MDDGTTGSKQWPRREVTLPAPLILEFRRTAIAAGLPFRSAALYNALADGVRLARSDTSRHLLPRDPGRGSGGDVLREAWTQNPDEYHEWLAELKAAESSPRAVLGAWMREYVRVGGDLPAMNWPFRGADLAIAV